MTKEVTVVMANKENMRAIFDVLDKDMFQALADMEAALIIIKEVAAEKGVTLKSVIQINKEKKK